MNSRIVICHYCRRPAELAPATTVYGPSWRKTRHVWRCEPCGAYVGVHAGTTKPLGRLANAELRAAKQRAHAAFDRLWRAPGGRMSRKEAYAKLARFFGLKDDDAHIGMFDVEQCVMVVKHIDAIEEGVMA